MATTLAGVISIQHIGVSVPDLALARRFYVDFLGALEDVPPLEWANNPFIDAAVGLKGSAARQFFCRLGNVQSEAFEYSAPKQAVLDPRRGVREYGYSHLAQQVEDVAAVHARILAEGLQVHAPPVMEAITTDVDGVKHGYAGIYCRDYFGNVFEILEIHECADIRGIERQRSV